MGILLTSSVESFFQLIGALIIFIFVLVITYFTTKWIGGYQKVHSNNTNLEIMETVSAGNNKMIAIVKAGKKYLVVAIGKEEMHILTELSPDELTEEYAKETSKETNANYQETFQKALNKWKEKLPKK